MCINVRQQEIKESDIDYSYYLGPDYKNSTNSLGDDRVSKVISPHVSCYDIYVLQQAFSANLSFVAGAFVQKIPFYGGLAKKIACVFVPRAGNQE